MEPHCRSDNDQSWSWAARRPRLLQYQKHIRLHEARQRLVSDQAKAATVGLAMGYERASQFGREYIRFFGAPPRKDADAI
ncbi:helix-turn-helix domain-containing protein [Devosia sp. BK]|uniref:helix-turn-helix domain-containing protein n=1 Tax=Devosia sp. BK TaxID=2871706 RepID=UPI00293B3831|nr:helix-turn-helix domain-containing protein [Devosia sp. BK]